MLAIRIHLLYSIRGTRYRSRLEDEPGAYVAEAQPDGWILLDKAMYRVLRSM